MNDAQMTNPQEPLHSPVGANESAQVRLDRHWHDQALCPSCAGRGMTSFYHVGDIPVHTILQFSDPDQARDYPRKPLTLAHCPRCDFVTNMEFDESAHEYAPHYEETQHYSPTFNRFADELIARIAREHDLRGKTVLEVGCGKGEFLMRLCERTGARGVGIDPAVDPQRLHADGHDRVRFIEGFFPQDYPGEPVDLICCRHTLEHIARTRWFVEQMVRVLKRDAQAALLIEVPAAERVLERGIFWDVYYEHCSYFTRPALHRLLSSAGMRVSSAWQAYDEQYLLMIGTRDGQASPPRRASGAAIDRYREAARQRMQAWRACIEQRHAQGERVVLWGAGSKAVAFLTTLGLGRQIAAAVDINPHRQGKYMLGTGHPIIAPERLRAIEPTLVIAMNPVYRDEIQAELDAHGVAAQLLALEDLP